MTTARQFIDAALAEVGTVETGDATHKDNVVRYWNDIGHPSYQGLSWCGAFVMAMAKKVGLNIPVCISTATGAAIFQAQGRWYKTGQPGDLVFFAWNNDGHIDHIGIVIAANPDGSYLTVEGNTSAGQAGSQRNGGMVAKRTRKASIVGFGRPQFDPPAKPKPPTEDDVTPEDKKEIVDEVVRALLHGGPGGTSLLATHQDMVTLLRGTQDGKHQANLTSIARALGVKDA